MTGRGRKKRSGEAALATFGDGWGKPIRGPWEYFGMGPVRGPDIVLAADTEAGDMWAHVTRAEPTKVASDEDR